MQKILAIYLISVLLFVVLVTLAIEHSCFLESAYGIFKDLVEPIIAITGIIVAYPLLKKKLIENHITDALNIIQETNRSVLIDCHILIDKYVGFMSKEVLITKAEVEASFEDTLALNHKANLASSDVMTLLFYLKRTLQVFVSKYNQEELTFLTSHRYYPFLIETLESVIFFCSKAVPAPISADTERINSIHEKIRKYVSHGEFYKYKDFNQGLFFESNSAHYLKLYQNVNNTIIPQLKRAAYQIHFEPAPVALLLHLQKIYAPLILENPSETLLHDSNKKVSLHLIGFNIHTKTTLFDGQSYKTVTLSYSNISDSFEYEQALDKDAFINSYRDIFLPNSDFDFKEAKSFKTEYKKVISIEFDLSFLNKEYKKVKSRFESRLKVL